MAKKQFILSHFLFLGISLTRYPRLSPSQYILTVQNHALKTFHFISFPVPLCFQNAIEVFKEVIKLQPDHIDAVTTLAQAYK